MSVSFSPTIPEERTPPQAPAVQSPRQSNRTTAEGRPAMLYAYYNYLTKNPGTVFGITLLIQLLLPAVAGILYCFDSDLLTVDFTDVPLLLQDDQCYKRVTAWNIRNDDPTETIVKPESLARFSRFSPAEVVELYYESKTGDASVLTNENLQRIHDFERALTKDLLAGFEKFCVLESNESCLPVRSLPSFLLKNANKQSFNATSATISHVVGPYRHDFLAILRNLYRSSPSEILEFLSKDARIEEDGVFARGIRSYLFVSWVDGINSAILNSSVKSTRTRNRYTTKDYGQEVLSPTLWNFSANGAPGLAEFTFFYYNNLLFFAYLPTQVLIDQRLVIGSLVFIALFLWLETQSLFMSAFGLLSILTNFFGAILVYRYVFDFHYFGVFHILSVFIILGIGVDDIFIFNDAWVASNDRVYQDTVSQLADVYHKAATSMLITSLTTAVSFYLNGCSPLLAISSFGLFSGLLVSVNFISVIIHFPSVVLVQHTYFSSKSGAAKFLRRFNCASGLLDRNEKVAPKFSANVKQQTVLPAEKVSFRDHLPSNTSRRDETKDEANDDESKSRLSKRLCNVYLCFITNRCAQVVLTVATLIVLVGLAVSATKLKVDTEPVKLYRSTHPLGRAIQKRNSEFNRPFYESSLVTEIYLIWGIQNLNRSHCHKTDWKYCAPHVVWDDNFDLNPYHAQKDMLDVCKRLRSLSKEAAERLRIKTNADGTPQISCYAEAMDKYFESELRSIVLTGRRLSGLPASDKKVEALMMSTPLIYNLSSVMQNAYFYRYFETAMLYWLYDGYKFFLSPETTMPFNWLRFSHVLGHSANSSDLQVSKIKDETVFYGTKLRYAAIVINSTLQWDGVLYSEGLEVMSQWEQYVESEKSLLTPTLRGVMFATPDRFGLSQGMCHWFKIQESLVNSAISGVVMSLLLSFPLLIFTTDDLIVGALATFSIIGATVCVIGVIPLAGWKLGALESLNLTMIVGLAIDYIVHIGEGYHLCKEITRRAKIERIVQDFGISVFSGAVTTLGASAFLLFAQILFFFQHGLFMFCCTGFALLFAMGIFMVLLLLCGPETDKFSVSKAIRKIWRKLFGSYHSSGSCSDSFCKKEHDKHRLTSSASDSSISSKQLSQQTSAIGAQSLFVCNSRPQTAISVLHSAVTTPDGSRLKPIGMATRLEPLKASASAAVAIAERFPSNPTSNGIGRNNGTARTAQTGRVGGAAAGREGGDSNEQRKSAKRQSSSSGYESTTVF